jgi:hypothetical protein
MISPLGDPGEPVACHLDSETMLDLVHGFLPARPSEKAIAHLRRCPMCEGTFQMLSARRERIQAGRQPRVLRDGTLALADRVEPAGSELEEGPGDHEHQHRIRQGSRRVAAKAAGSWRKSLTGTAEAPRMRGLRWAVLAAPVAAVLVASVLVLRSQDVERPSPDLQDASVLGLPSPDVERPGLDLPMISGWDSRQDNMSAQEAGSDPLLEAGIQAYQSKDFAEAVRLLQEVKPRSGRAMLCDVYMGSALAHEGQLEAAAALLESALTPTLPDPPGAEGYWTWYVCLCALGDSSKADSLLKALAERGPGIISEKARKALEQAP